MPKQIITVIDELSNKKEVDLVSILSGTATNKLYIVFSEKIQGETNHIDLIIAEAHEKNNELAIKPIRDENELLYAKNLFYDAVGGFANV